MALFTNLVLAAVRLLLVITFMHQSQAKFKDLKGFAKNDGISVGAATLAAVAEGAAALGMLTGVLAFWAGLGIILLMLGTSSLHWFRWHTKYWAYDRGWEYDMIMIVLAAVIVAFGPGDWVLFSP